MAQPPIQIQISNLHKSYRDGEGKLLHILKGVELSIPQGATVSIVGASGTGKSTFLHLLGALDKADKGEILVESQKLSQLDRDGAAHFRNRVISFVFQFHHLLHDFTALENVMMPLRINNQSAESVQALSERSLQEVGLQDRLHHKPFQLSGGEQQRVAIARAIANSPKILLADEPTGNLDEENGKHIIDLLLRLNKTLGITLVVITHNSALASIMQYQYRMADGLLHPVIE